MVAEQWQMDHIFIDLRGREFRGLNREIVPSRRTSLDVRTYVIRVICYYLYQIGIILV